MVDRIASVERNTKETQTTVELNLDGSGVSEISTGIGFFDHMLTLMSKHSLIDLRVKCDGDLEVDAHHTVEDVGITIGKAISQAVGDKSGIARYGSSIVPMDEALIMTALDLSGRGSLVYNLAIEREKVGAFDTELAEEFLKSLCTNAGINAHVRHLEGGNSHHVIEAAFKSFARALRQALSDDPRVTGVPSTKGTL